MLEIVNALTAENWHMFKTMKEHGMIISEIARKNWSDQENCEEIYRNGETCEIQQIEEGLSLPLKPIM